VEAGAEVSETGEGQQETGPTVAEVAARQDGLEAKVDKILEVLGKGEGQAHTAAQQHTEDRLDRPSTIAEQVRAQLEEAKAREAADAEKRGQADRLAAVEARVSGMAEAPPEPPQRRIEKFLGWR
jgi:septal ring factor EnvC (AmiA/AmiB activator)